MKPFISIIESVILGKPMLETVGDACETDGLSVTYKKAETIVDIKGKHPDGAPKVYHFAQNESESLSENETENLSEIEAVGVTSRADIEDQDVESV